MGYFFFGAALAAFLAPFLAGAALAFLAAAFLAMVTTFRDLETPSIYARASMSMDAEYRDPLKRNRVENV
ncbi:MAG: hypothetical protein ACTHK7_20060, partial [Aureliella sp.]